MPRRSFLQAAGGFDFAAAAETPAPAPAPVEEPVDTSQMLGGFNPKLQEVREPEIHRVDPESGSTPRL
jgi:hypothetical protein